MACRILTSSGLQSFAGARHLSLPLSHPEDNIADVSRRLSFSPLANHEPSSPQADIPIIVPSPPHRKLSQPVIDSIDEWLPNQPSASPTPISPFAPSTLLSAGFKALSPTKPRSYTHALKKSPTVKPRARTDRVRTLQPVVRDDSPPATKRTPKPRSAQANNKKKKRAAPEPANLTVLFDPASPESSPTQGARGRRERASKKKTRRESLGTVETPNNGDEDGPVESKPPKAKAQRKGRAPNAGLFTPTAMPLRSRSHKSKVKVVIQSQLELTPVTPTAAVSTLSTLGSPDTVRRSARKRFAPLEFWKNERPVYETDEDGLRNTVGLLIRK
eukprot:c18185_g1_i4.p1 GENE.c18185_g1_i4~~c18185_g1_i4.p1  ORF type:complete len:330 (-),score=45.30 c18185_g1_i4:67-1056(-)